MRVGEGVEIDSLCGVARAAEDDGVGAGGQLRNYSEAWCRSWSVMRALWTELEEDGEEGLCSHRFRDLLQ